MKYLRKSTLFFLILILSGIAVIHSVSITRAAAVDSTDPLLMGSQVLSPENASQAELLGQLGRGKVINARLISANRIWAVETSFGLQLYDAKTGRDVFFIESIDHYIISPDEKFILTTARGNGSVKIWDPLAGSLIASLDHSSTIPRYTGSNFDAEDYKSVIALSYSPDGKWLATAYGDLQIVLWDTTSWKQEKLLASNVPVRADRMLFSPDGQYLLAQSPVAMAVWLLSEAKLVNRIPNPGRLSDHPFSPDQKLLAASLNRQVRVYSFPTGKLLYTYGFDGFPDVTFSGDGKYLIVDEQVRRLQDGRRLNAAEEQSVLSANATPAPNSNTPATLDWQALGHWEGLQGGVFTANQSILVWGFENGQTLYWRELPGRSFYQAKLDQPPLHHAVLSPDQQTFAICTSQNLVLLQRQTGSVKMFPGCRKNGVLDYKDNQVIGRASNLLVDWFDIPAGKVEHNLNGHKQVITALDFSNDQKWLASGSNVTRGGAEIYIWRLEPVIQFWKKWKISANLAVGEISAIRALAFSPDASQLAVGGADEYVKLYRVSDNWLLKVVNVAAPALDLAFSPDGKLLAAAGGDGSVHVLNSADGKELIVFRGHTGQVVDIAFSSDGKTLLSVSNDGALRLWGLP